MRLGTGDRLVVLLHGLLLGNVATWYFGTAPALACARRVLLYDLRGHGRSARPASGYALADHVADLEGLLADEQGPVELVGHSFGGLVALAFALRHPARVAGLVLVDTPLPPGAPDEIGAFLRGSPEAMLAVLPAPVREAVAGGRRQARRLLEHLVDLATRTTLLDDLAATPPLDEAALRALEVPVGLVYGDRSGCRADGERLAALLPRATLRVLPGGHYLHLDAPEALTAAVCALLEVDRSTGAGS